MGTRGLLAAVVLLVALGGLVWWSNKAKEAEEKQPSKDAPPKIITLQEDQIQQVAINRKAGESIILRKADSGSWQITAPQILPADQDAVKSMLSTLASLSSDRLVEEKASDLATYGLAAPATKVVVTMKDGKAHTIAIGDETPTGSGAFTKLEADARIFTIATYNKSSLDKKVSDLRDRRLLRVESDKVTRVELQAKGQAIEFGKNAKNEWTILKPRPLRADNFQAEELVRKLREAKMDLSVTEEESKKAAAAYNGGAPVATAKVTDNTGTQQIEVRKDKDKNYYAKSSAVEGIFKVPSDLGEGVDKALDDFRNKKLFDFGFNDPSKVEVKDGAKVYSFQKTAEKWMAGPKQMDSVSVQSLIDKLRDLSSIKFVDTAGGNPLLELAVTSQDGKSTEKVLVAKQGNSYYARRENEPAFYELDGKVVEEIQKAAADVKEPEAKKDDKKK